jgi:hypothetical protein
MAALAAALLLGGTAHAAGVSRMESHYTDLDFDRCTTIEATAMGATSACPGYQGYPVVIAEDDLRMFVSFGITPTAEKAMQQTLPPFSRLGARIEWRVENDDGFRQPRATILRWFTARESGEPEGQVLIVTQLKPGATCQIAWIDALAVGNANEKAREIADRSAGTFDCTREPEIVRPFEAF